MIHIKSSYVFGAINKDTIIQTAPIKNTGWHFVSVVDEKDLLVFHP